MAPGDLLTAPDQVEFDGVLIDGRGPWASGVWLTSKTDLAGWTPGWNDHDVETSFGTTPGTSSPAATYPSLTGVAVETPELLLQLERAMARTVVPRPLCWWDVARDLKLTVLAAPRGAVPSTATGVQHFAHRVVDLRWLNTSRRLFGLEEGEHEVSAANPLIAHAGAVVAPWRLVWPGPGVGPRIRNIDDPELVWRFDALTLTSGQTLEVDSGARTALVLEDGEDPVSVWHLRTGDGGRVPLDWGILPTGTHVGFARTSGASSADLFVRPAW